MAPSSKAAKKMRRTKRSGEWAERSPLNIAVQQAIAQVLYEDAVGRFAKKPTKVIGTDAAVQGAYKLADLVHTTQTRLSEAALKRGAKLDPRKVLLQTEVKATDTGWKSASRPSEPGRFHVSDIQGQKGKGEREKEDAGEGFQQLTSHLSKQAPPTFVSVLIADRNHIGKAKSRGVEGISVMSLWEQGRKAQGYISPKQEQEMIARGEIKKSISRKYGFDIATHAVMEFLGGTSAKRKAMDLEVKPAKVSKIKVAEGTEDEREGLYPDYSSALRSNNLYGVAIFGKAFILGGESKKSLKQQLLGSDVFRNTVRLGYERETERKRRNIVKPRQERPKPGQALHSQVAFPAEFQQMTERERAEEGLDVIDIHVLAKSRALEKFQERPSGQEPIPLGIRGKPMSVQLHFGGGTPARKPSVGAAKSAAGTRVRKPEPKKRPPKKKVPSKKRTKKQETKKKRAKSTGWKPTKSGKSEVRTVAGEKQYRRKRA